MLHLDEYTVQLVVEHLDPISVSRLARTCRSFSRACSGRAWRGRNALAFTRSHCSDLCRVPAVVRVADSVSMLWHSRDSDPLSTDDMFALGSAISRREQLDVLPAAPLRIAMPKMNFAGLKGMADGAGAAPQRLVDLSISLFDNSSGPREALPEAFSSSLAALRVERCDTRPLELLKTVFTAAEMPHLRVLQTPWIDMADLEQATHGVQLPALEELGNVTVGDGEAGARSLVQWAKDHGCLTTLRKLSTSALHSSSAQAFWGTLAAQMPHLSHCFVVDRPEFIDAALADGNTSLKTGKLTVRATEELLRVLEASQNITSLRVLSEVGEADVDAIARHTGICSLELSGSSVAQFAGKIASSLPSLRKLRLADVEAAAQVAEQCAKAGRKLHRVSICPAAWNPQADTQSFSRLLRSLDSNTSKIEVSLPEEAWCNFAESSSNIIAKCAQGTLCPIYINAQKQSVPLKAAALLLSFAAKLTCSPVFFPDNEVDCEGMAAPNLRKVIFSASSDDSYRNAATAAAVLCDRKKSPVLTGVFVIDSDEIMVSNIALINQLARFGLPITDYKN